MSKDIKRLDLNTTDGVQLNMDALYQKAPSCFTEAADPRRVKSSVWRISTPCASCWAMMP